MILILFSLPVGSSVAGLACNCHPDIWADDVFQVERHFKKSLGFDDVVDL